MDFWGKPDLVVKLFVTKSVVLLANRLFPKVLYG